MARTSNSLLFNNPGMTLATPMLAVEMIPQRTLPLSDFAICRLPKNQGRKQSRIGRICKGAGPPLHYASRGPPRRFTGEDLASNPRVPVVAAVFPEAAVAAAELGVIVD